MKVRIYSPFLPYPVTEGAYRVIFDQAFSLLALGHDVELVTWKNSPGEFKSRAGLWKTWRKTSGNAWDKSGAKAKAHEKADGETHGRKLQFRYLGPHTDSRTLRILSSCWGNEASPESFYYPKAVLNRLKALLPCDLAIYHYSFAHLWLKFPELLPLEKRRVVHFHNLESDLSFLQLQNLRTLPKVLPKALPKVLPKALPKVWGAALATVLQCWIHRKNFEKLKIHETELSGLSQELWFLSPVDLAKFQTLENLSGQAILRLIPPTFSAEISRWSPQEAVVTAQQTVLGFIGGFDFQPTIDSAKWILNRLVPALEEAGFKGKVQIAGRGAQAMIPTLSTHLKAYPDNLKAYPEGKSPHPEGRSPMVEVLPDSFDVDVFFAGLSWMLVPHLTGSGVRIKLLDALSKKIPVMATPSAVERLHPELHEYPLILSSDDPVFWANQALLETPQGTRLKYHDLAFPQAMSGMEIYRDV